MMPGLKVILKNNHTRKNLIKNNNHIKMKINNTKNPFRNLLNFLYSFFILIERVYHISILIVFQVQFDTIFLYQHIRCNMLELHSLCISLNYYILFHFFSPKDPCMLYPYHLK